MQHTEFDRAAEALVSRTMTFDEFVAVTAPARRAIVQSLRRKFRPIPPWCEEEDTEQDLLIEMYLRACDCDAEISRPARYLRWGEKTAIKRIQKARGVEQHRRLGPARFELPIPEGESGAPVEYAAEDEDPDWAILRSEYYAVLRGLCETAAQHAVVAALEVSGGDRDGAATRIYDHPAVRDAVGVRTLYGAAYLIDRVVEQLIEAYGDEGGAGC